MQERRAQKNDIALLHGELERQSRKINMLGILFIAQIVLSVYSGLTRSEDVERLVPILEKIIPLVVTQHNIPVQ